ncbi:hypothetical protein KI387_017233, partial [Taxus chinensis]
WGKWTQTWILQIGSLIPLPRPSRAHHSSLTCLIFHLLSQLDRHMWHRHFLNFISPPPPAVFTSPRVSSQKELNFLRRASPKGTGEENKNFNASCEKAKDFAVPMSDCDVPTFSVLLQ